MKAMTRKQLAACAGVSSKTLRRYIAAHRKYLGRLGYRPNKKLPPAVVRWIAANYGVEIDVKKC